MPDSDSRVVNVDLVAIPIKSQTCLRSSHPGAHYGATIASIFTAEDISGVCMSDSKRHYVPPTVVRQPADAEYLAFLKNERNSHSEAQGGKLSSGWNSHQQYVTVVDCKRRYVEVSDDFCKLVGYSREELLKKKYDDLTASSTNNVETVYSLFEKLGYMHGLWMLVSREGTRILIRYESWLRSDDLIEAHMEVLGAGY